VAIICRLIQLTPDRAMKLSAGAADSADIAEAVQSARVYSDVYRYWDGIGFLLARHRPGSDAARWLESGVAVSGVTGQVPGARILGAAEVAMLDAELRSIEADDLAPHYDAALLDQEGRYPRCWQEWEETFDPLGQMLEHYSFLQHAAKNCATAGNALLLYFVDNGDDD
jgi:hypothetical protein